MKNLSVIKLQSISAKRHLFAKGSHFGGAGASAPERASPVKLLQRRCDTMALTSRVRIAVCLALWQHPCPLRLLRRHLSQSERLWQSGTLSIKLQSISAKRHLFAKGSHFGGAGASAPERASPVKLLQRRCDTMALTSRVRIAVCLALWQHPCPLRLLRRHLSQSERLWQSGTLSIKLQSISAKRHLFAKGSHFGGAGASAPERLDKGRL